MCGIFGFFQNHRVDINSAIKMSHSLRHRGPDDEGFALINDSHILACGGEETPSSVFCMETSFTPKKNICNLDADSDYSHIIGHRRLSIQDVSPLGHQPMCYSKRYWIVFNGEIYNHIELRVELEKLGHRFQSHSDTEVLLAAYAEWGTKCLQRFNGMWAFVIYDSLRKEVFISRDRMGVKPLYYTVNSSGFIFASEIKGILCHPEAKKEANLTYLEQYLLTGPNEYIAETAFSDIYRLEHSTFIHAKLECLIAGDFTPIKYWHLPLCQEPAGFSMLKSADLAEQYYALLEDAVRIRLRADVEVGSALSGGLDSSSIVYLVNQLLAKNEIKTQQVTFSTVYRSSGVLDCDESSYINILAQELGVEAHCIEPRVQDIPEAHAQMIWHLDTPPESTLMSSWHTFKLVQSRGVRVTLDGQGADEQLAGYTGYLSNDLIGQPLSQWPSALLGYFGKYPSKAILTQFPYAAIVKLFGIKGTLALTRCLTPLLQQKLEKGLLTLNQRLQLDTQTDLLTLLHYADRTSMAFNVESRMPFLDYRLVEFLTHVSQSYKLHNGWSKYLARMAFNTRLPDRICWRKDKMGWPIPESYWLSHDLKKWFQEKTSANGSAPLRDLRTHVNNIKENGSLREQIRLLNVNVWAQTFSL